MRRGSSMSKPLLILCFMLFALPSVGHAIDRYVDATTSGCSSPTDTDYNPATESCGSGSELVYTTINGALAVEGANDNVYVRAGTYAEYLNNNITSGSGPGFTNTTNLIGYPGETVTVRRSYSSGSACLLFIGGSKSNIVVRNIIFDGVLCTTGGAPVRVDSSNGGTFPEYIKLTQLVIANSPTGSGVLAAMSHSELSYSASYNNGVKAPAPTSEGDKDHGIYLAAGTDNLITHTAFHDNTGYGIQIYPATVRTTITHNYIYDNGANSSKGCIVDTGDTEIIRYNTCVTSVGSGIEIAFGTATRRNTAVEHNTIYCNGTCTNGVRFASGTGHVARNNIILGFSTATSGTATYTTNRTSGTATDIWVDPANGNFSLKAGSAAINAGTNIGLPFNGANPDQGSYETFGFSSGTITGNTAEGTLGMALHTPVAPTTAGWSLNCTPNPTACPTPTIIGVTLKHGASGTVLITYSGTACAAGQLWTVTYDPATGATTDTTSSTFTFQQELSAITTQSLTNACTGSGGPTPPATPHIHYLFNENTGTNANDESANNLDCTLTNGAAWGTGLTGSSLLLANGTTQHCAILYGSGINPITTSHTIAFWAKLSTEGLIVGANNGNNQRLLVGVSGGTARLGVQNSNSGTASEFGVTLGDWTHFCVTFDKDTPGGGTGTATLHINGVAGASAGSVKSYTSFTFASNWRIGNADINTSPGVDVENFKTWTSVVSCADEYASANPPSTPWTGNLASVAYRFYAAKYDAASAVIPLAVVNTDITVPAGAAFTVAVQTDGTVSDPTAIAQKLYYHCAACPSADADLAVPVTATTDGIEFWGTTNEQGLLSGDHGARLSGALTYVAGGTNLTADAIPVVDLAQNNSTVMRWVLRIAPGTPQGRVFCFTPREQTGVELNGSVEGCVTVGPPIAHGGP